MAAFATSKNGIVILTSSKATEGRAFVRMRKVRDISTSDNIGSRLTKCFVAGISKRTGIFSSAEGWSQIVQPSHALGKYGGYACSLPVKVYWPSPLLVVILRTIFSKRETRFVRIRKVCCWHCAIIFQIFWICSSEILSKNKVPHELYAYSGRLLDMERFMNTICEHRKTIPCVCLPLFYGNRSICGKTAAHFQMPAVITRRRAWRATHGKGIPRIVNVLNLGFVHYANPLISAAKLSKVIGATFRMPGHQVRTILTAAGVEPNCW